MVIKVIISGRCHIHQIYRKTTYNGAMQVVEAKRVRVVERGCVFPTTAEGHNSQGVDGPDRKIYFAI